MSKPVIGEVIRGMHGTWTVVGLPVLERSGQLASWKVLTLYESRRGERASTMTLSLPIE
jgi:hypothetical protein